MNVFLGLLPLALSVKVARKSPHLVFTDSSGTKQDVVIPGTTLQSKYPFYHSTQEIHELVTDLEQRCSVPIKVNTQSCGSSDCLIDTVDIGDPKAPEKVFLLFGEHARELISPETAIRLLEDLCAPESAKDYMTREALKVAQFRIIPNGNPSSRAKVEFGQYCLRTNENGVDLNRNWGFQWSPSAPPGNPEADQLDPGDRAFSEKETQIFKAAVEDYQPTVFAAIHSGTMGMYMPWAFADTSGSGDIRNGRKMSEILSELDSKYCQCPSGAAASQVGYDSPGTCLDWVHSRTNVKYSYAFEIYTGVGVSELRDRYREQKMRGGNSLLQMSLEDEAVSQRDCFNQFNPDSEKTYMTVVNNWSKALIELPVMASRK